MRILLIKTSSMGDLIHTLPALTDAGNHIPGIRFDWLVEENFTALPALHPLVDEVIPVSLRRWRKGIFSSDTRRALQNLRSLLKERQYDLILDAQGLVKSAFLSFFANGVRAGLDWSSARESLASLAYQRRYTVNFYQHAIVRMRQLFSQAFSYPMPDTQPDFGLNIPVTQQGYLVFLHGTSWSSKQWPENYWIQLANLAGQAGFKVKLSGANAEEMQRAQRMAAGSQAVEVMPNLTIAEMTTLLAGADAVVALDTGFGHLAAALDKPTVSIYGSTNPDFTGALGKHSQHLAAQFDCAPCLKRTCHYRGVSSVEPACYATVPPEKVWQTLTMTLPNGRGSDKSLLVVGKNINE